MQPALHLTTNVLPGNKIEREIPEGEIGDTVDAGCLTHLCQFYISCGN